MENVDKITDVDSAVSSINLNDLLYRNPVWANEEHTSISLEVRYLETDPWMPSATASFDPEPSGRIFFARVVEESGDSIGVYDPPNPTDEEIRALMPSITRRQLRLTLVRNGISLASVSDAIDSMPHGLERDEMRIEWDDGTTYERLNPRLNAIAEILDLSDEQVDVMWKEAQIA